MNDVLSMLRKMAGDWSVDHSVVELNEFRACCCVLEHWYHLKTIASAVYSVPINPTIDTGASFLSSCMRQMGARMVAKPSKEAIRDIGIGRS